MSNLLSDNPSWKEAFDFLSANLAAGESVMVPDEWVQLIPNSSSYLQSDEQNISQFSWIIFHKGRLKQVDTRFLIEASVSLTPVLANAVFVIFSNSVALLEVDPNHLHLEPFLTRVSRIRAATEKPIFSGQSSPVLFDDPIWNDVLEVLKQHSHPGENFLLPDEFCPLFPNAHAYPASFTEHEDFQWILLHKGRLSSLSLEFLMQVCQTQVPVFGNEVFVLFSPAQIVPEVRFDPKHVRMLMVRIWYLRIKSLLEKPLQNKAKPQSQSIKSQSVKRRRQLTILVERSYDPRRWFTPDGGAYVPLTWAATSPTHPFANLGDALSPIMVSALSGLPVIHRNFDSRRQKLACVGTIGHGFKNGTVHFWGTGIDPRKNPIDPGLKHYTKPPHTRFQIHALRGLLSASTFKKQGIEVPEIYGDPIWFLPALFEPAETKQYDLGVIVHLSELSTLTDAAEIKAKISRYTIPDALATNIRIITTITQPTFAALEARVKEITACKRIVSTSLHGLVIAETYGIPCTCFRNLGQGAAFARLDDEQERVDLRIRDFYSGVGLEKLFIYGQRRSRPTDWEDVIQAIDQYWSPVNWSPEPFLESFPLPLSFNPLHNQMLEDRSRLHQIQL